MNKKIIFRIIGALASALIIVSVFIPFVSVTGYTYNLWESFAETNSLYLPIMIIVFGVIGVIFFSLNIKTEFAYMSTGAITFFVVMRTIDILNQGAFSTLSVGYYFLAIGALLTGIMAFLTNLKTNKKVDIEELVPPTAEPSMLDQIDKLYNDQTTAQDEISAIQPVNNVVEPLPVQPLETIAPVQPSVVPVVEEQPVEPQPVNPIVEEQPVEPQPVNPIVEEQPVVPQPVNPVLQEFNQPSNPIVQENSVPTSNPVVQEFSAPESNPVVQDFSIPQSNPQPVIQEQPVSAPETIPLSNINEPASTNPVLQEFTNPGSTVAPQQSNNLDIFG